jgi:hypothetical protein
MGLAVVEQFLMWWSLWQRARGCFVATKVYHIEAGLLSLRSAAVTRFSALTSTAVLLSDPVLSRRRGATGISFAPHLALLLACMAARPVARLAQALAQRLQFHP